MIRSDIRAGTDRESSCIDRTEQADVGTMRDSGGYTIGEQRELKRAHYQISPTTRIKAEATFAKCKSEHPTP
jgi:hypothetical protein